MTPAVTTPAVARRSAAGITATAAIAVLTWAALALQFVLSVRGAEANGNGWLTGASRYFGFFTILTNLLVAVVLSAERLPPRMKRWLSRPDVRSAVAAYITMVGIVYTVALRHLWMPEGLQYVADVLLHDIVPVSYLLYWAFFVRNGSLLWSSLPYWLAYPLGYLVYSLLRGAMSGWYPYHFIDASELGYAKVIVNAILLMAGFSILGGLLIAFDRWTGQTQSPSTGSVR